MVSARTSLLGGIATMTHSHLSTTPWLSAAISMMPGNSLFRAAAFLALRGETTMEDGGFGLVSKPRTTAQLIVPIPTKPAAKWMGRLVKWVCFRSSVLTTYPAAAGRHHPMQQTEQIPSCLRASTGPRGRWRLPPPRRSREIGCWKTWELSKERER